MIKIGDTYYTDDKQFYYKRDKNKCRGKWKVVENIKKSELKEQNMDYDEFIAVMKSMTTILMQSGNACTNKIAQAQQFGIQLAEGMKVAKNNIFLGNKDYEDGYTNCISDIEANIDDFDGSVLNRRQRKKYAMRDATPQEIQSVNLYIDKISKHVGNFDDLLD